MVGTRPRLRTPNVRTASPVVPPVDLPVEDIQIEKLVYGGDGLGRLASGEVVFTPWSAPGDRLKVTPKTGRPLRGSLEEILEPSLQRVVPRCDVFMQCGGCQWQHLNGESQRDWKRRIVEESLQRLGKLENVTVLPTIGDDASAWAYRNRAQWDVDSQDSGAPRLGYHAHHSRDIVEFDHCHIIPDELNNLALQIRRTLQDNPGLAQGLKRIEVLSNEYDQCLLILESLNLRASQALAQALIASLPQVVGIASRHPEQSNALLTGLTGQTHLFETLEGKKYRISADSFFQTNPHGARQLLQVLSNMFPAPAQSLLDIYAGVGVFALHFSTQVQRVLAIESAPSAVLDAQENLRLNAVQNVTIRKGEAQRVLSTLKDRFDVAIVDPPRGGCTPEVLDWLSRHVQQNILYVSCNPTTLARDLKLLVAAGWTVELVQPIDMFPQTYHVECVVKLRHSSISLGKD